MPVTLRLQRHGQKKRPFYRIVAADSQARRDGRYLEIVGTYNPMVNPAAINLKEDRIKFWVANGAGQSELARALIKKQMPGLVEAKEAQRKETVEKRRAKRKPSPAAAKKKAETKSKKKSK
ncbi:MAG: 30S ribosomal protein S16 [Bdellovibrionales bacterium]|nr:30S ribosomal protein S16 [Bdellovibrionales bacterium]